MNLIAHVIAEVDIMRTDGHTMSISGYSNKLAIIDTEVDPIHIKADIVLSRSVADTLDNLTQHLRWKVNAVIMFQRLSLNFGYMV